MKTKKLHLSKSKRPNRLLILKTEPAAEFQMSAEEPHMYQTKKYLMDLTQESEELSPSYQFNPHKPQYDLSLTKWNHLGDKEQPMPQIYASLREEVVIESKQQISSITDLNHSQRNMMASTKKSKAIHIRPKYNQTELKEKKSPQKVENKQIFELHSLNCSISNQNFKVKSQSICLKQLNLQIKVSESGVKKKKAHPSKFDFLSSSIEKDREPMKKLPEIQRLHGIHGNNKNKYNLLFKAPQSKKLQALVQKSASIINQSNFLVFCDSTK